MNARIRYLPNNLIDREAWDKGVVNAVNRRIYSLSYFLDIISPKWEALIMDEGQAFMPVTWNRKYGISYVAQPLFIQQLGCFYTDASFSSALPMFIEKLSGSFRFIDIALNEMNNFKHPGYHLSTFDNYLLKLDKSYPAITRQYNFNTRRNIIKACRLGLGLTTNYSPSEIINLFTRNNGRNYPNIRRVHYARLNAFLERGLAEKIIEIMAARTRNGDIIAAACFLKDYDRHVYFFSANTDEGRKQGAMFLLIDSFIERKAATGMLLDLNGSMNAGLARFYRGFGAEQAYYQRLRVNRLIFPLNLFK
jgi:hypothetical protein